MDGIVCVCICEVQVRKTWRELAIGVCVAGVGGVDGAGGSTKQPWSPK